MHTGMHLLLATLATTATACAASPDDLFDWATITHAGNRPTNDSEMPATPGVRLGAVNYEFRIATTEVTVGQWFEFVQVYAPYYDFQGGNIAGRVFTSSGVNFGFDGLYLVSGYSVNRAADMSWEYAARYANWLHNGKASGQWAFESGAYDTSTFTYNPDGSANHQATRSEGAKYWIPSRDEWTKAAYYDPNRYGEGKEGYWNYPNQSDIRSITSLLPEDGGQSNSTLFGDPAFPLDVGSFTDTQSYFGLLDLAGGVSELTDSPSESWFIGNDMRYVMSNAYFDSTSPDNPFSFFLDRIDYMSGTRMNQFNPFVGLRLASATPCPADLAPPSGTLNAADLTAYLDRYQSADPAADLAEPFGILNFFDLAAYLAAFNAGCP